MLVHTKKNFVGVVCGGAKVSGVLKLEYKVETKRHVGKITNSMNLISIAFSKLFKL